MSDIAFSVLVGNGYDDIIFKTIMLKGQQGNSIASIRKTSTSGKVDTYTITLTDGTIGGTFTVTNGEDGAPVNIDDTVTALDKTWSSSKLSGMIKSIDDSTIDADKLWSSQKINSMIVQTLKIENQAIASFSDGADNVPVSSLIVDINAFQAGSGTPSPTNVRAISGWDKCNVSKFEANIWNEQWEEGSLSAIGIEISSTTQFRNVGYIPVKPMTLYVKSPFDAGIQIFQYDSDKTYIARIFVKDTTITLQANCAYIRFRTPDTSPVIYNNDISINYPATDTEYHAYNGGVDTIDLTEMVYGGFLNVSSGVLTITHKLYDLGNDFLYSYQSANARFISSSKQNEIKDGSNVDAVCEIYENGITVTDNNTFQIASGYLHIKNTDYSDVSTFRTAMIGKKIAIELASPRIIQLSPIEVRTMLGNINILADTGNVDELVYFKTGSEVVARMIEAYMRGA